MSLIYVLQKEVPGLDRLTKIGMTMRSGEDRAAEYGGGGWGVVDELPVAVDDPSELKDIEARIHDRLEKYRCAPAVGFGLTEVFTCSADTALTAARAEVGSKATDSDRIDRLRKRTNKMIERKIMQAHAADLARLHMGTFTVKDAELWEAQRKYHIPFNVPGREVGEWLIHQKALEALDTIRAEAPTFRAMLLENLQNLQPLRQQWDEEQEEQDQAARARLSEVARARREERQRLDQQQAVLAAHNTKMRAVEARVKVYGRLIGICVAIAGLLVLTASQLANKRVAGFLSACIVFTIVGAYVGLIGRERNKAKLAKMRRG